MSTLDEMLQEDMANPGPATAPQKPQLDQWLEEDIKAEQARNAPPKITGETPWSEVLSRAPGAAAGEIASLPATVGNVVQMAGKAIADPKRAYNKLANTDWNAVGSQLKHDYLTEEGWKQGIGQAPLSRLMDISMLAAGPEALAARGAAKAGMTGLARGINIASKAHDPAAWAVGATKFGLNQGTRLFNEVAGEATGTGGKSLNLLLDAGLESKEMAKATQKALNATDDPIGAVRGFEQSLDNIEQSAYTRYRNNKHALKADRQRLSFAPAQNAIRQAWNDFAGPASLTPDPDVVNVLNEATKLINQRQFAALRYEHSYGSQSPINPYSGPIGMDELKKTLGRLTKDSKGEAKAAIARVQEAVANEIKQNSPIYDSMMQDYAAMRNALDEFHTELSLTKNPGTALRKLHASLRNNVTANYNYKWGLVERLAAAHPEAREALYKLAGQTNAKMTPRGLWGAFQTKIGLPIGGASAAYAGVLNPWLIPMGYVFQSPYAMGNAALWSGRVGRRLGKLPWRPIAYTGNVADSPYVGLDSNDE